MVKQCIKLIPASMKKNAENWFAWPSQGRTEGQKDGVQT